LGAVADFGTINPLTKQYSPFIFPCAAAAIGLADCTTAPEVGNPIEAAGINKSLRELQALSGALATGIESPSQGGRSSPLPQF
jgi:hypothetical protein